MSSVPAPLVSSPSVPPAVLTPRLTFLLATAVGSIAANLYYAQPLVAMISRAVGLAPEAAGLVVTLTQIGYGLGVLMVVPLGDILENRRLILTMIGLTVVGLGGLAFATSVVPYFIAAFATGLGASAVQILIPYAAHFAPEERRGQVVGSLMSGLMTGIMLSRPLASVMTDLFSWHAVFVVSALLMVALALTLARVIPPRRPQTTSLRYGDLLKSMGRLFVGTPLLRRRGFYQAFIFGSFCLFWTASPLYLAGVGFHLSQTAIAVFALVGVAGAVSAPFAGRAADRGKIRVATFAALGAGAASFLLSHVLDAGSPGALVALVISAILLDAGVTANLVLGQRAIFSIAPEARGRLNGLYIAMIFVGGACGSALGAWAYARGEWALTSWVGFAMNSMALAYFFTEKE